MFQSCCARIDCVTSAPSAALANGESFTLSLYEDDGILNLVQFGLGCNGRVAVMLLQSLKTGPK